MQLLRGKTNLAPCQSRVRPFASVARPVVRVKAAQQEVEDVDIAAVTRVAEEVMSAYAVELLVDEAPAEQALEAVAENVDASLESARGQLSAALQATAATLAAGAESAEVAEIADWQSPAGFRKYDEQEEVVSEEELSAVAPFKLTRQELTNLVPADWANTNVEWFASKKEAAVALPEYKLSFLWQEKNIAVAVDQVYSRGQTSPLTEYFFWPRKDAWEELKAALESRPWVAERDKVILLNRLTEVINFWQQEEVKHSVDEARAAFPDCAFA